jgi:hypothetical protein
MSYINFYQQLGLTPIPLQARSKKAAVPWESFQTQPPSIDVIRQWFNGKTTEDVNVGIVCGTVSGNLIVFDIDSEAVLNQIFTPEELSKLAKETLVCKTARGVHIYFLTDRTCPSIKLPEFSIDVKSHGGYVVAPPSIHPSGTPYTFLSDETCTIKRLPDFERWFWQFLESKLNWKPPSKLEDYSQSVRTDEFPPYRGKHPSCIAKIISQGVDTGSRHILSLALSCYFKNIRRYAKKRTLGIMLEWWKKLPEPETFPISEIKNVVEDAYKGQYNYGCRILIPWCSGDADCTFGKQSSEYSVNEVLNTIVREQATPLNGSTDFTPDVGLFFGYPVRLDESIEKLVIFSWSNNPNELSARVLDVEDDKTEPFEINDTAYVFKVNPMLFEAVKDYPEFKRIASDLLDGIPLDSAYESLAAFFETYVEMPDSRLYDVMDVWVRGTYMSQMFAAFPYIWFVGMIRTGKTKATSLLSLLSFRGHLVTNPSSAFIFRDIESVKPTLCIDEATGLDFNDKDIVAILNSGYKKGIKVPRVNMDKDGLVEFFDCYCPKVINGLSELSGALADRSIKIEMVESEDRKVINKTVDEKSNLWTRYRHKLLCWCLERSKDIWQQYITLSCPSGISGRDWELWRPLLAIAKTIDERCYNSVLSIAEEFVKRKVLDMEGEIAQQILRALITVAPEDQKYSKRLLSELFYEVQDRLGGQKNAPKWLTYNKFQFILKSVLKCVKSIDTSREGTFYTIHWDAVRERARKRGISLGENVVDNDEEKSNKPDNRDGEE